VAANQQVFDYVIVGAGATGCTIANRLTANPAISVLLLEAGEIDTDPRIAEPGRLVQMWGSELDWKIATEEQPGMAGRQIVINQGRVLGGSTSLHAMMWVRGNRRNFDAWQARGADGWSYRDVLPYLKKSEDYEGGASEYHGVGGPLPIRDCPDPDSRSPEFMAAAVELGYDGPEWDTNGERQENGAGLIQFTISADGKRASAATAFLAPAMDRPNLTVRTSAEVSRVLFDGKRAIGVEYQHNGQTEQARADREVIVSAGAFLSPKLLMLSGVGPADHLRSHGITPVVDLPGVGQNLQDHLQLPVVYRIKEERPNPYILTGNVLFVNTRGEQGDGAPDLQLNFTPAVPQPLVPVLNLPVPAMIFLPILVQPASIGEVRLRSGDPRDLPIVNPNYLQQEADVKTFVAAVKLIRDMVATKAFSDIAAEELVPGGTDLEGYIRGATSTLWHPAGTCAIGDGEQAVVDPSLRVRGVQGLRVADASVMPIVPSGNTQAGCYMIGERLSDMLLAEQG
jgi:choline dehydrogenase